MQVQYDPATGLPMPSSPAAAQAIQPQISGVPQEYIEAREHYIFTLPLELLPESWKSSGRPDSERSFALTLLSMDEEEKALKNGFSGGTPDPGAMSRHWLLSSIYAIGGVYTRRNFDRITEWLDAVGPKGRKIVDACFGHLHNITAAQGEAVLAGMQRKG